MVRRGQAGFTLLELLIVMTLIGILATIAIPSLIQYPIRAKEAVLKNNLKEIRDNLERFYADKGRYPATFEELSPKYLKVLPVDPFMKNNTCCGTVVSDRCGLCMSGFAKSNTRSVPGKNWRSR